MRLAGASYSSCAAVVAALSADFLSAFLVVLPGPAAVHAEGVFFSPSSSTEVAISGAEDDLLMMAHLEGWLTVSTWDPHREETASDPSGVTRGLK